MFFTPAERRLLAFLTLLLSAGFLITGLRHAGILLPPAGPPGEAAPPPRAGEPIAGGLPQWSRESGGGPVSAGPGAGAARPRSPAGVRTVGASPFVDGYLDLNRADSLQLLALPGIGPTLAGRILHKRRELGGFGCPEELLEVKGIGEKRLSQLSGLVSATDSCILQ